MTFQAPPPGPGSQPGDSDNSGHDDYDTEIAARFSLLDEVPVPETWPPKPQADNVRSIWPVWQSVGVAAAAAVVIAVAATTLLTTRSGDGSLTVDAADGPRLAVDEPAASEQTSSDGEDESRSAFDSGDDGERSTTTAGGSTGVPEDEPPTLSIEPDETEPAETEPAVDDTTGSETGADDTKPKTTEPEDSTPDETEPGETTAGPPVTLPATTEVSPTLSFPEESWPTLSLPPDTRPTTATTEVEEAEGQIVVVRGLVTEVFTDCQSMLILAEDGEVVRGGPVSCDGGSHIVVDGVRIQTSAGFVASDQYYDRHPKNLLPGQRVEAVTIIVSYGERRFHTLDCDRCGVGIGR